MQHFKYSILISIIGIAISFWWGGVTGAFIALILSVMEVSLSFDNAVVNAAVLKKMDEKWQKRFLLWGMLIAVFGMRLVFPVVIVAVATGLGMIEVSQMALSNPDEYAKQLMSVHVSIAAFGGMFLLLVFLYFLLDHTKDTHWIRVLEVWLGKLGKLESIQIVIAMFVLLIIQGFLHDEHERLTAIIAGLWGIMLYVVVSSLANLFEDDDIRSTMNANAKSSGMMAFIYLEILDASFSFDGVIGAFAITTDVVIIMIGLAIGAMFVRSMTIYLVRKGTLEKYIYLEHGAHYAIGALAIIMLMSTFEHIPEVITGLIGVAFIILSLISSVWYNRTHHGALLENIEELAELKSAELTNPE